ncbi:MAG: porin family protein [Rickettsiales bacterium]
MKKIAYLSTLLFVVAASPAFAQSPYYGSIKGIYVPGQDVGSRDYDNGWGVGLALGKNIGPNVRTEAELFHIQSDVDAPGGGKLRLSSAMANMYYDVPTGTAVTPYVGAGLGGIYGEATSNGLTDDDDFGFGYQFMAGANVTLGNGHAFYAGYRYLDGTDLDVSGGRDVQLGSHNVEAGYRIPFAM